MRGLIAALCLLLCACSGGGGSASYSSDVVLFCDSMGTTENGSTPWQDQLSELMGVVVDSQCVGGSVIDDHDIIAEVSSGAYKFGVVALGINDIYLGSSVAVVIDKYGRALDTVAMLGIEPVCFAYPSTGLATSNLNAEIIGLCESRNYRIIYSSDQIEG